MTFATLWEHLHQPGYGLRLEGQRLIVTAPDGILSDELTAAIREHRADLVATLEVIEILEPLKPQQPARPAGAKL